jgi:hypothetical protein
MAETGYSENPVREERAWVPGADIPAPQEPSSRKQSDEERKARETGEQAREKVKSAQEEVKKRAGEAVESTKEQGYGMLSEQKTNAARELKKYSHALHSAAAQLHQEDGAFAGAVDGAAERLDSASRYMDEHSPEEVFQSVNNFAHRQPAVFWGGMLFAGLAISRFFKASQPSREQVSASGSQQLEEERIY